MWFDLWTCTPSGVCIYKFVTQKVSTSVLCFALWTWRCAFVLPFTGGFVHRLCHSTVELGVWITYNLAFLFSIEFTNQVSRIFPTKLNIPDSTQLCVISITYLDQVKVTVIKLAHPLSWRIRTQQENCWWLDSNAKLDHHAVKFRMPGGRIWDSTSFWWPLETTGVSSPTTGGQEERSWQGGDSVLSVTRDF